MILYQLQNQDCICAVATAPGMGAIAVIRISGKEALSVIKHFLPKKKYTSLKHKQALFTPFIHPQTQDIIDEVVLIYFKGPHSYTGEDVIEISIHGSIYLQQSIIQLLIANGCRLAEPGEFTMRAFHNNKLDLSRAEAVSDVISSENERAHQAAMNQMRGGVSNEIQTLRQQLIDFAALIELELDFSEEDVEFANRESLYVLIDRIIAKSQLLIQSFQYGNAIKNGIPTVIAGKPNAGKSTLLNALLNEDRALVSDIAGTTRDTIEEVLTLEGIPFRLIDTAGIREHAEFVEGLGIERTMKKIAEATVILYMFDCNQTNPEQLKNELQGIDLHQKFIIYIGNKIDTCSNPELLKETFKDFNPLILISSKNQTDLKVLTSEMVKALPFKPNNNDLVLTNVRHVNSLEQTILALQRTKEALQQQISGELVAFEIRDAIQHLGSITGEIVNDDLLSSIFTRFCIGK